MADKVIVTHLGALEEKYGRTGLERIRAAVDALAEADRGRDLATELVALDDAARMGQLNAPAVTDASSAEQAKRAIDGVFTALTPDYLMILGAPDVVPHQALANPVPADGDPQVDSDLPYACDAGFSREPEDFRAPSRVVSRLPDIPGERRADYLAGLMATAAGWSSSARDVYDKYFSLSADSWKGSTGLSLERTFGDSNRLFRSPPRSGSDWSPATLAPRAHFINCHGAAADPSYYGDDGQGALPMALTATRIEGRIAAGTVAAAECCYGAELYDPALTGATAQSLCHTYLAAGAYGFFGSSTISYGPAEGNGAADLICQIFLQKVLAGASLGRAALEARLDYLSSLPALGPIDLKTLAQFHLMGDPSIHPVAVPTRRRRGFAGASPSRARRQRREAIARSSLETKAKDYAASAPQAEMADDVRDSLAELVASLGVGVRQTLSYEVQKPAGRRRRRRGARGESEPEAPERFHVIVTDRYDTPDEPPKAATAAQRSMLVVVREAEGKLVDVQELHRR